MTDKELIKQQQEKIERIEQLQKDLHKLSMLGLITVDVLELDDELKTPLKAIPRHLTCHQGCIRWNEPSRGY